MAARPRPVPSESLLTALPPMLLDERPFDLSEEGWAYEIKFDGYRLMAKFGNGEPELRTRNGALASSWFPEIFKALNATRFPAGPYVVDGEVCVLDEIGRSDFDKLHDRARRRRWYPGAEAAVYCVFDLLVDAGKDITGLPYEKRKKLLKKLLTPATENVLYVAHFETDGQTIFESAVLQLKLEGLIAKRLGSTYQPGVRSPDWVKVKRKGAIPPERFRRKQKG